ncbi:MAG: hypothetical protein HKP11_01690 [Flavobacteriaceae bacterium]|nr:hypothetical protein [Flavobacteriaceae bacterium]
MPDYPEIRALKDFIRQHSVSVDASPDNQDIFNLVPVIFTIQNKKQHCYIHDEYDDLQLNDPCVKVVLALREFELIEESTDYLNWCTMMGIEANSEVIRNYYQDTVRIIRKFKAYFKRNKITSFIPDLDFQLNSGAMKSLRNR